MICLVPNQRKLGEIVMRKLQPFLALVPFAGALSYGSAVSYKLPVFMWLTRSPLRRANTPIEPWICVHLFATFTPLFIFLVFFISRLVPELTRDVADSSLVSRTNKRWRSPFIWSKAGNEVFLSDCRSRGIELVWQKPFTTLRKSWQKW